MDFSTIYENLSDEKKFAITGEAIEMELTLDQDSLYNQRFSEQILKNDGKFSRTMTTEIIGKDNISLSNVKKLYQHVLNGKAILILESKDPEVSDTRNVDLLLKQIPSVAKDDYEKISTNLVKQISVWIGKNEKQKQKIEEHLKKLEGKLTGIVTKIEIPTVSSSEIESLKKKIELLILNNLKLKEVNASLSKEIEDFNDTKTRFTKTVGEFKMALRENIENGTITADTLDELDELYITYPIGGN